MIIARPTQETINKKAHITLVKTGYSCTRVHTHFVIISTEAVSLSMCFLPQRSIGQHKDNNIN